MKISVAICTYNGGKFIKEQLDSIISQTSVPDEIVVGDDCSTDDTLDIIEKTLSCSGIEFRIIKNKKNLGVNANFQNVIQHCNGDVIFTSDQDDVWIPTKVEKFMKCFEEEPEAVLAFSNAYVTDENLRVTGDLWSSIQFTETKKRDFMEQNYYNVLFSKNYVTGAAMAFKKEFVMKLLSAPFVYLHDYWIALHAPLYGTIEMIDDSLFYYRQHGHNVIGVNSNKFLDRIRRWIKNTKIVLDNSEEKYFMSKAFFENNCDILEKLNLYDNVKQWVNFNYWRDSLRRMNGFVATFNVLKHMAIRDYRKFYSQKFAGFHDFLACLFFR